MKTTEDDVPFGAVDEDAAAAAMARLRGIGGAAFDRSQMDALKAKLAKLGKSEAKTTSGSEAPEAQVAPQQADRPLTGRDIDWSEYDLDFNIAHLYPKAVFRPTPQGPMWVAMAVDFYSTSKEFRKHGDRVNAPGSIDKRETESLNLGEYLNDMVNGREQWKISAVMPSGSQCGLLLEREVPIILPHPTPLKKKEEVDVPTDPALQAVEDAALAFKADQEGLDNEEEVREDTTTPEDVGLRPIEKGTEAHKAAIASLDEDGAIPARRPKLIAQALETAAPLTTAAPQGKGEQPSAVAGNEFAASPINPEGKVPAAGYTAAQELLRALSDPNFRAQLPQEE